MKPLLVGESNPYQKDARMAMRYALHPDPPRASGGRLCYVIMGLDEATYLASYDRTDLCFPKWSWPMARRRAAELAADRGAEDVIVLCGVKVAAAFGMQDAGPFAIRRGIELAGIPTLVVLPHPSGRCRVWYESDAVSRARAVLREVGILAPESPQVITASGHDSRCYLDSYDGGGYFCVMECPLAGQGLRGVPEQYR